MSNSPPFLFERLTKPRQVGKVSVNEKLVWQRKGEKMASKVFVILSSGDREVALEVGLVYPLNAKTKGWMDEVKVIIFGPSEKIAAYDMEVQGRLKELQKAGVEVMACKWCADRMNIAGVLEEAGIPVVYVGSIISDLLKDGWASLTF